MTDGVFPPKQLAIYLREIAQVFGLTKNSKYVIYLIFPQPAILIFDHYVPLKARCSHFFNDSVEFLQSFVS